LFIAIVSATVQSTDDYNKKTTKELIKEIAETEAQRIQLKAQSKLAQDALRKETNQMTKEHKERMNKIAKESSKILKGQELRESLKDAKLAEIKANGTYIEVKEQANALKKMTSEELAKLEYQRKINLRDRIDAERRRRQINKLKMELNQKQKKLEEEYNKKHEKEERAFTVMREKLWRQLDNDRRARKEASLQNEINLRKLQDLELEKFKAQLEMERKMKRLTIAETQKQLLGLRKAEEVKREIVREGLKYKKLLEEKRMKEAEAKAKMIEDLKDKAVQLMLEKENLIRIRNTEAKQLGNEVATVKREIDENARMTQNAIKARRERNATVRKAKIIAERNKMRFRKIRAMRIILARKLVAEQALYKKKVEEAKKMRELDIKARKIVKTLSKVASSYDKKSIDVLKKIKAEKKALLIRKLLQEKAEEINAKRKLINSFKLKIHKLEEAELKEQMKLSGVARDVLNQKTLARIIKMKLLRENKRRRRIATLKRRLDKMFMERRDMLLKKRCLRFRKTADMKQREEARKRKIARIICGNTLRHHKVHPKKCFDFVHGRYHHLIQQHHRFGCPFTKKYGVISCDKIELP